MNIEQKYLYLLVNVFCISVPFLFSFHPKLNFYKNWKALFLGIFSMMANFIPWDIYFTSLGVWGFNPEYISGIFLFNLPIEEWLFFICIPYACLFSYECTKYFTRNIVLPDFYKNVMWGIAFLFLIIAITNLDKKYTFAAHLFAGTYILHHLINKKSTFLKEFMLTFLILLVPFIISNGVLTGVYFWEYPFIFTDVNSITEKIVWYNNDENLSLRIFTMPIEDISYGLTMLLLVTSIYESISSKKSVS